MPDSPAIQDLYPPGFSHCYGCGRLNANGLQIKSYWNGSEAVAEFLPQPHHLAYPGFVYGGLLASVVDCHAMATAAAAACAAEGRALDTLPGIGFVTAALNVDYRSPTPVGEILELHGRAVEVGRRKVIVAVEVRSGGQLRVSARAIAVRIPASMRAAGG